MSEGTEGVRRTDPVFTQSITFQNVKIKIMGRVTAETTLDAILKLLNIEHFSPFIEYYHSFGDIESFIL